MISSLFFVARLTAAWLGVYLVLCITLHELLFQGSNEGEAAIVLGGFVLAAVTITGAFSHVRRVRLIAGGVDAASLSRRQRRQVEIPLEAGEAFDLVDAAIRELPGAHDVEAARDSLQVRARIERVNPYPGDTVAWKRIAAMQSLRNQVLATVAPNGDAGSVTLICEPERAGWTDWFFIDYGTNLENAEAL